MAEGGENPKVNLKTFWPHKDVEFMIEMLRATGRYEVVPLELENVSGPDNYGHVPATSTPLSGKGDSVQSEFSLLGHTYPKVPPPVPKRESSQLIVHRTTSNEPPKSPTLIICQSVLASSEKAPAVECVLLAQDASIGSDEVGSDIGSDISQVDWQAEQTMDSTLNRVIQLLTSGHKPTKRQIALESKECQKVLKDWYHLFFKDNILFRRHSLNGTSINQLVLPEIYRDIAIAGLHDEAGHQGRDRTMSLVKSRFYWPGMDSDIEKKVKNCSRCIRRKTQSRNSANLVLVESTYPMDLVCMDFCLLRCQRVDMKTFWLLQTISPAMLRHSHPRTRLPKLQPDFFLTTSFVITAFPRVSIATKDAISKVRLSKSCVPLPT